MPGQNQIKVSLFRAGLYLEKAFQNDLLARQYARGWPIERLTAGLSGIAI
jgi:hypothetical protein